MNRKLLALNGTLAIAVIYGGYQLESHMSAAKSRQTTIPGPALKPAPPPTMPPLPQQPPVLAAGYKDIAVNHLFDPSRNPNVPVEPRPDPPPPPPPPPLPALRGIANFGDGPVALLSEAGQTRPKEIHVGETIGPFKLLAFDRQEFSVEWEGKVLHRKAGEGIDDRARAGAGGGVPAAQVGGAVPPAPGVIPGVAPEQPASPPPPQQSLGNLGPGQQLTDTVRSCQSGDGSAAGAMVDGYRKVIQATPMGSRCMWISAK